MHSAIKREPSASCSKVTVQFSGLTKCIYPSQQVNICIYYKATILYSDKTFLESTQIYLFIRFDFKNIKFSRISNMPKYQGLYTYFSEKAYNCISTTLSHISIDKATCKVDHTAYDVIIPLHQLHQLKCKVKSAM